MWKSGILSSALTAHVGSRQALLQAPCKRGSEWLTGPAHGMPFSQMGYLKKLGDGSLLYSVVNAAEPDADGECLPYSTDSAACRPSLTSLSETC